MANQAESQDRGKKGRKKSSRKKSGSGKSEKTSSSASKSGKGSDGKQDAGNGAESRDPGYKKTGLLEGGGDDGEDRRASSMKPGEGDEEHDLDPQRKDFYRNLLRQMILIRRFEEKAGEAYSMGQIGGFCHLYIGQEAVAVGSIAALREDDVIFASYREHAHALARGVSADAVMAELYGKETGCSGGMGGSMHLFDRDLGFLGGHAIVGAHIPLATGAAFAFKYRSTDQVALCYFGEAAVNQGAFHEALNMAALWKLPAIFLCENNRYGMGTALERASAIYDIYKRSCSYDLPSRVVDGMDVLAVYKATLEACERAREEKIPTLLEVRTYRFMGHSMSDPIHGHYRSREEVDEMKEKDPIPNFLELLKENDMMTDEEYEEMDSEAMKEVEESMEFAEESDEPDESALHENVYRD